MLKGFEEETCAPSVVHDDFNTMCMRHFGNGWDILDFESEGSWGL